MVPFHFGQRMIKPTPESQVEFLTKLQRLLAEGSFVSTYKHALLMAIADLSVELGDDSGDALVLSVSDIAEKFITYYWPQTAPFLAPGGSGEILRQNTGDQVAVIRKIEGVRGNVRGSAVYQARADKILWSKLKAGVASDIKKMPLWKLQTVGGLPLDFLYPNVGRGGHIELRPGIAFCFRRFHRLVGDLVRGAWVRAVMKLKANQPILGQVTDISGFMFGTGRADLSGYQTALTFAQDGVCLYCEKALRDSLAVDHFIPWSLYPVDLGHNFVLAHAKCNSAKADRLAAARHLERWCRRNEHHGKAMSEQFTHDGLVHDLPTTQRIAVWAYAQVGLTGGHTWEKGDELVPLAPEWENFLTLAVGGRPAIGARW
jgi:hypothetical protein